MELLAPAGNMEGFKAVLAQKPDVIYLGAGDLNARSAQAQLALDDLPELVQNAARQGVKIYFTLNILLKDEEISRAQELASIAHKAGVYAFIVQDKGLMLKLKEEFPDIRLHASTQCSVGTKEQILELNSLDVERIVLARELSLSEIRELTDYAHNLGIQIEVFTHGATCMSVSGQCHMSYCIGGRSANRGECAQPCRKRYRIHQGKNLFRDFTAALSPKDLSYFPYLKELAQVGVDALKIEGRLRNPEYQSQVTAIFKTALEEVKKDIPDHNIFTKERQRNLEIAFNRGGGFQSSFLMDHRDAHFLSAKEVGHRGLYLGKLKQVRARQGSLIYLPDDPHYLPAEASQISLKNEEGITVATAPVGVVQKEKGGILLKGFHPKILSSLYPPLTVWQQKQASVPEEAIREKADANKLPLHVQLTKASRDYCLLLKTEKKEIIFSSAELASPPATIASALEVERIEQQLAKLGNTPYELASFQTDLAAEELPAWRISDLNAFRRAAIEKLMDAPESVVKTKQNNITKVDEAPLQITKSEIDKMIYLPNYQYSDELETLQGKKAELFVFPLEELILRLQIDEGLTKLRASLGEAKLGAYLAPVNAWSSEFDQSDALRRLTDAGLFALVSSTSGTREMLQALDLDLELFLWQGGQVSNLKTFHFFAHRGYYGLMISPELNYFEQVKLVEETKGCSCRPILMRQAHLESMFTRFCPIGYSRGKSCSLCRKNKGYQLEDEDGRIFPLTPKLNADCSLQIWHSQEFIQEPVDDCILAYTFLQENERQIRNILDLDCK